MVAKIVIWDQHIGGGGGLGGLGSWVLLFLSGMGRGE